MITHTEAPPPIQPCCLSAAKLLSQHKAFYGSPLCYDFWVQKTKGTVTALLSLSGGEMTLCGMEPDVRELREFIRIIQPASVFCETETAEALGLTIRQKRTVVKAEAAPRRDDGTSGEIGLSRLYSSLQDGADGDIFLPCFEAFAADVSHRLRHGGACALLTPEGCALSFLFDGGGIVSGIAVKKELRGRGCGTKLLNDLLHRTGGRVFACTTEQNAEFYLKNGFTVCGTAAYCTLT